MSLARDYFRDRVRYQRDRIRSGLAIRHSRPWGLAPQSDGVDDVLRGVTVFPCQRARLHHGIRKGIRKLRRLRALLAEVQAMSTKAGC